ncbi:hypothetical protein CEXT_249031 [Caerostris extrusa]|uniref:Uncharacterized protein n=1 Tax=Caerostris extrusa TaxID=172846 RepID=A0AAV4RIT0_CAEEX|nr:hypothetical protein CEXT_249031 [Caerostris extrusa]
MIVSFPFLSTEGICGERPSFQKSYFRHPQCVGGFWNGKTGSLEGLFLPSPHCAKNYDCFFSVPFPRDGNLWERPSFQKSLFLATHLAGGFWNGRQVLPEGTSIPLGYLVPPPSPPNYTKNYDCFFPFLSTEWELVANVHPSRRAISPPTLRGWFLEWKTGSFRKVLED